MAHCSTRTLIEFRVRRLWCAFPWMDIETVAVCLRMTVPALRMTLAHIDPLSADAVMEYGRKRLRDTNSTNARLLGFLRDGNWWEF